MINLRSRKFIIRIYYNRSPFFALLVGSLKTLLRPNRIIVISSECILGEKSGLTTWNQIFRPKMHSENITMIRWYPLQRSRDIFMRFLLNFLLYGAADAYTRAKFEIFMKKMGHKMQILVLQHHFKCLAAFKYCKNRLFGAYTCW